MTIFYLRCVLQQAELRQGPSMPVEVIKAQLIPPLPSGSSHLSTTTQEVLLSMPSVSRSSTNCLRGHRTHSAQVTHTQEHVETRKREKEKEQKM